MLLTIPNEIILEVLKKLPLTDWFEARLICRRIKSLIDNNSTKVENVSLRELNLIFQHVDLHKFVGSWLSVHGDRKVEETFSMDDVTKTFYVDEETSEVKSQIKLPNQVTSIKFSGLQISWRFLIWRKLCVQIERLSFANCVFEKLDLVTLFLFNSLDENPDREQDLKLVFDDCEMINSDRKFILSLTDYYVSCALPREVPFSLQMEERKDVSCTIVRFLYGDATQSYLERSAVIDRVHPIANAARKLEIEFAKDFKRVAFKFF